nr:hypothetical protein [Vibrio lentus]
MDSTMSFAKKLAFIKDCYGDSVYKGTLTLFEGKGYDCKSKITKLFVVYSNILSPTLDNKVNADLISCLKLIATDLSQRYTHKTVCGTYCTFKNHILKLIKSSHIEWPPISKDLESFFNKGLSQKLYDELKDFFIPEDISSGFRHIRKKDEVFEETLRNTCSPEIADRLREHVRSYKKKVSEKVRSQLIDFLNQISGAKNDWYNHPMIIQGELVKFRGNSLDRYNRNTVYQNFYHLKKSVQVLIDHGLLPSEIDLPDNLRQSSATISERSNNPVMSEVNLYDKTKIDEYKSAPAFLEHLQEDIQTNLTTLIKKSQEIVYEGYHTFLLGQGVVAQYDDFIERMLDKGLEGGTVTDDKYFLDSGDIWWPKQNETDFLTAKRVAYFYEHYELYLSGQEAAKNSDLKVNSKVTQYLGLTLEVASAMQAIIVEEIGINPFSLYYVLISSDGLGREFVQVTDEGSVRLRALKRRAKHAKTRTIKGSLAKLSEVEITEIDAATCLKMALEMTSRARAFSKMQNLWLCRTLQGVSVISDSAFQDNFNKLRAKLPSENKALQDATLKKIRVSKGVLIFLESKGDSIKTATYLGNEIETSLSRYIPSYLSELIYRIKIRSFQNLLLYMAISSDESPSESLNISESEFKSRLKVAFSNPGMGGDLYDGLVNPIIESGVSDERYFCVSSKNIELALNYIKDGEDPKLKGDCIAAISAIAESSVIMKKMLRSAQLAVQSSE